MKLAAAEERLVALSREVGEAVLAVSENTPGAAKRLEVLRSDISVAEREVGELSQAVVLAERLDREADAKGAVALRDQQLAVMRNQAERRLKAMERVLRSIEAAAKAYAEYAVATGEMVVALPTGASLPTMAMGHLNYGGSWIGDCDKLLAGEAWRLLVVQDGQLAKRLPFARAPYPTVLAAEAVEIEPALDVFAAAQTAALKDVEGQVVRLNSEALARAEGAAA
ncbi:hypothetical protein CSIRO_2774 [Bradyrhizobiaceae bacterium SG-6C]|nr:hypothetical protein CSIRO_2774 [Bradyrhizobiaceae bacterium SG-6C]